MKVKTVFQVVFCILAVASVIAATIVGFLKGLTYFLIFALLAVVFAFLMILTKYFGTKEKKREQPDFLNSPEENERIIEVNQEKDSSPKN